MNSYKIDHDELLAFAKKIYDEACCGYMDLKESICDSLINEFVCKLTKESEIVSSEQVLNQDSITIVNTVGNTSFTSEIIPDYSTIIANDEFSHNISLGLTQEVDTSQVRIEEYIRPEQNFYGNESERF